MATARRQEGVVRKIYRLESEGYETLHSQFTTLSKDLSTIKKQILDLQGKSIGLNGNDLKEVNKQIIEASKQEEVLKGKIEQVNEEGRKSIAIRKEEAALLKSSGNENAKSATSSLTAYQQLNQQYQVAKKNAQEMAALHGVESAQAREAAAAADAYRQQLVQINQLVKTGGKSGLAERPVGDIPFEIKGNLGNDPTDGGQIKDLNDKRDAINEVNRAQAEAAITATQYGEANKVAAETVKESASVIDDVRTKYEEYTGSIRQNIQAHLENEMALNANRAQQKEIEKAIKDSGSATTGQINQLTALRQEEQLLVETNKSLAVTIRNQAKEFNATTGSLDEGQAQLNQLQQAYEGLSEAEKATPFGESMKKEIDELEPKVKALEYELGKFSRNVGNYPQAFGGAFKVVNTELDKIQAKIVSGNFSGKELDDLVAKQNVLQNATQSLGQEFTSTAQATNAYKEAGRQLALVFGTDSEVFRQFSQQVSLGNEQIRNTDRQLTATTRSGNAFGRTLTFLYGGLRKLANILPGLGISTLLLLIPQAAQAAYAALFKTSDVAKQVQKDIKEAFKDANEEIGKQVGQLRSLVAVTEDANVPLRQRQLATQKIIELNKEHNRQTGESIKLTTDQNGVLVKNDEAINALAESYIKLAKTKALMGLVEKAYTKILDAEQASLTSQTSIFEDEAIKINKILTTIINPFRKGAPGLKQIQEGIKQRSIEDANTYLKELQERLNKGLSSGDLSFEGLFDTKGSSAFKDLFYDIDAEMARLMAIENTRINEITKDRKLSYDEEAQYYKNIEKITTDALNKKIKVYNSQKSLDAKQKADREKFREESTKIVSDTNKKLNDIEKKRFDDRLRDMQNTLDSELKQIELANKAIQDSITAAASEKANAQLTADEAELVARQRFYDELLTLSSEYNKEAVQKAKDGISEIEQIILRDRDNVSLATLKDIQVAIDKELTELQIQFSKARKVILDNDKLTSKQRAKQLEQLEAAQKRTILSKEIEMLNAQLEVKRLLLQLGLLTDEEYLKSYAELVKKAEELSAITTGDNDKKKDKLRKRFTDLKSFIQAGVRDLFKIDEDSEEDEMLGRIIAESFSLARDAMNAFFDAEEQRIRDSLALQEERIDMETEQLKARAQTQAEIDSIERQAELKKEKARKEAGEKLKKVRKAEAKIALATELANIAVQASAYPFPASLIIGAALSALAFGRYGLRVREINQEQFEFGGQPGEVPVNGGKFGGRPHSRGGTDFSFKGKSYNAEVDELAVVRTKNAPKNKKYRVEGTQMQIASAMNVAGGGTDFKPGARAFRFATGGYLGDSLQAPVLPQRAVSVFNTTSGGVTEEMWDEFMDKIDEMNEATNSRIDRMEVVQDTDTVTNAQKKRVKQSSIGTF